MEQLTAVKITANQILSHSTWDLLLLFVLIAGGFFYGITIGRRKVISAIIYTYVAYALIPAVPFEKLQVITNMQDLFFLKIIVFTLVYLLLVVLLGRGGARAFSLSNSWWQVIVLSFVQAGLLIHIILSFLPAEKIKLLAPLTRTVIANPDLHIWWLLAPLVILAFIRKVELKQEQQW